MPKNLLTAERRRQILELIQTHGSIQVGKTAALFDVSNETIRKDLVHLDERGLLKKSHGGAIAAGEPLPVGDRSLENSELKNRIARKALECLSGCDAVLIDSGSTVLAFASILPKEDRRTIVTNSFAAAGVLLGCGGPLFFAGGQLSEATLSTSGLWTGQALSAIQCDAVFLGSSGFLNHRGPSVQLAQDAEVKRAMLGCSRRAIVLADSSKFRTAAFVQYADWNEIDLLITDAGAPEEMVREIRKTTEVVLA